MESMRASRDEPADAEWRPPRGRWQPADGQAMLAALAASGQTPSAFARAHGFGSYRVSYWRARLEEPEGPSMRSTPASFVAVAVRDDEEPRVDTTARRVEV